MKKRKQVYELASADFEEYSIWEFALDEEGEAGQDEATVRPWERGEPLDPAEGMFVVRANFVLADGTSIAGYVTPPAEGATSIGTIQPVLLTPTGQIGFWCGAIAPTAEAISSAYAKLGRDASEVFPCRYSTAVTLIGGPITGTILGFMHFRSFTDRTVVEVR